MDEKKVRKILKHAKDEGTITIKSTADSTGITIQTAKNYLMALTLKGLLKMEEQQKEVDDKDKSSGYTYRFWRLKEQS